MLGSIFIWTDLVLQQRLLAAEPVDPVIQLRQFAYVLLQSQRWIALVLPRRLLAAEPAGPVIQLRRFAFVLLQSRRWNALHLERPAPAGRAIQLRRLLRRRRRRWGSRASW